MRLRLALLAPCLALLFSVYPAAGAAHAAAPKPGSFYLAIGDSYSLGALTPEYVPDPQCVNADTAGFSCILFRYLRQINPSLQIHNVSETGADSCLLTGVGHHCYDAATAANPLDGAVQFLKDHPGQVSPITVTVGGNDLLPLLPQALTDPAGTAAQLPQVLSRYRTNLDAILARLRDAAGPDAEIIVTTQINPLGGIGSPPLPPGVPELAKRALDTLDGVMKTETPKYGAVTADVEAAFDANPGGSALLTFVPTSLVSGDPAKINAFPTPDGYKVFADAVIKASGYILPLKLSARLVVKTVHPGKSVKVKGQTSAGALLRLTIKLPNHKTRNTSRTVDATGAYSVSFRAGNVRGKGTVKVCASDASGEATCSAKLAFTVR